MTFPIIPDIGNLCLLSFSLSLSFFFCSLAHFLEIWNFVSCFLKHLFLVSLIFSADIFFFLFSFNIIDFESSVQLLSRVRLFGTPWTTTCQASLSITNSRIYPNSCPLSRWRHPTISSSVVPFSSYPQSFPASGSFQRPALHIRWPKYWSFSFNISPSNEYPGLISFRWTGWISLQSKGLSRVFSNTTVQKHQFFCARLSL